MKKPKNCILEGKNGYNSINKLRWKAAKLTTQGLWDYCPNVAIVLWKFLEEKIEPKNGLQLLIIWNYEKTSTWVINKQIQTGQFTVDCEGGLPLPFLL